MRECGPLTMALIVTAVLAVVIAPSRAAQAKGPDWLITGGKLGNYAMKFYPEGSRQSGIELASAEPVNVLDGPGPGYEIYSDTHLFSSEFHLLTTYFPDVGLLRGNPGGGGSTTWLRPSPATASLLDRAITEALTAMREGALEPSLVGATFKARNMHQATYKFSPYAGAHDDWPRFELTAATGADEFAMEHLVSTIEQSKVGSASEKPLYRFTISGQGSGGYYSPPSAAAAGRWFSGAWSLNGPNTYFETTPGFDAFIQAAIERARAEQAAADAQRLAANAMPVPCPPTLHCWTGEQISTLRPTRGQSLEPGADRGWVRWALPTALGASGLVAFGLALRPALARH